MARRRKHRSPLRLIAAVLAVLFCCFFFLRWSNHSLRVDTFTCPLTDLPQSFDGLTIVHLSDLHGAEFGEGNHDLLLAVSEARPDLIVITGDLLDQNQQDADTYIATIAPVLSHLAPTYFVTGNHEWARDDAREVKSQLSELGVTVLSNAAVTLTLDDASIILAGIDDPNGFADQKTPEELAAEIYEETEDPFWILLSHRNTHFAPQYSLLGADLVLSGHGHGGMIRLPFTDGLISTERTLFPSYTAGFYEENDSTLFVSRGLGSSGKGFRLFNRPQVAVITLTCQ